MNLNAVAAVEQYDGPSKGLRECTKTAPKKCIQSTALNAGMTRWCRFDPGATDRCIAVIASARCVPSLHLTTKPE